MDAAASDRRIAIERREVDILSIGFIFLELPAHAGHNGRG
jgi:hypothetical protein